MYLSSVYTRTELDYVFFQEKFKQLIPKEEKPIVSEASKAKIERLFHDVLAQWDALLYAKILEFQLSKFAEQEEQFIELLNKKVKEYQKIRSFINPVTEFFGCLLYTSPSPRDLSTSRMPSSA